MNVMKGVTLTTEQLSKLKTMPANIDTTVIDGLYVTTEELNYVSLNGNIGSFEASKVISADANNTVFLQNVSTNQSKVAIAFKLSSTGTYDPKMSLNDCKNSGIGTYISKINNAAIPKGCAHFSPLTFYNADSYTHLRAHET